MENALREGLLPEAGLKLEGILFINTLKATLLTKGTLVFHQNSKGTRVRQLSGTYRH